jgi:hypothetical protein
MMRRVLLALLALAVAACDNDNNGAPPPPVAGTALFEVVHAYSNAPNVNLILNGTRIQGAQDVPFKAGTAARVVPDVQTVEVEAITPAGDIVVIPATDIDTPDDQRVSVFAVGLVGAAAPQNLQPVVLTAPEATLGAGQARLRVAHFAPTAPMVDIYLTAPSADLAGEAPDLTLMFPDSPAPFEVPAGDYQVRIAIAGSDPVADPTQLVYDSGTITVADGADLIVAAVDSTLPGGAAVSLLVADGGTVSEIIDADTPASVRVVHASPDAPDVDILLDDAASGIAGLPFGDFTDPSAELPAGSYNVKVVETTTVAPAVIDADLDLVAGTAYSVYAVGFLADLGSADPDALPIEPLVLVDDNRSVALEARLRIVHASPTAQDVDIYLVAPGADIAAIDPTLPDVPYLEDRGYLSVAPGAYDVIVTAAGDKLPAIGPAPVTLDDGGVYTVVAIDADGGGAPLGVILMDDF